MIFQIFFKYFNKNNVQKKSGKFSSDLKIANHKVIGITSIKNARKTNRADHEQPN